MVLSMMMFLLTFSCATRLARVITFKSPKEQCLHQLMMTGDVWHVGLSHSRIKGVSFQITILFCPPCFVVIKLDVESDGGANFLVCLSTV